MFDASNRDQCEVRRISTNTPLQALIMLNDPMVLEASRVLAERLMLQDLSVEDKIAKAARLILCRKATSKEMDILTKFYEGEKEFYKGDPEKAKQRLEAGEYKHEKTNDVAATAALMQVVSTLYNMDEAITK